MNQAEAQRVFKKTVQLLRRTDPNLAAYMEAQSFAYFADYLAGFSGGSASPPAPQKPSVSYGDSAQEEKIRAVLFQTLNEIAE